MTTSPSCSVGTAERTGVHGGNLPPGSPLSRAACPTSRSRSHGCVGARSGRSARPRAQEMLDSRHMVGNALTVAADAAAIALVLALTDRWGADYAA